MENDGSTNPIAHAELDVTAEFTELPAIRSFVRRFCDSIPDLLEREERTNQLELAVNEAVCNIMEHAYHGRSDGGVRIEADAFDDHITFRIHHQGESFDPSLALPPSFDGSRDGGFGLYMMGQCVDEVTYLHDEEGRSYTRLVKHRS